MENPNLPNRTILIVDDHPIIIDSYQTLLSTLPSNKMAKYLNAFDCKETYLFVKSTKRNNKKIDCAFIDVNLPAYEEKQILSGSDLAMIIREIFPECKIIIISMHKEPLWVNQIFKSVNPDGFIAKSDINYKMFPEIVKSIEKNEI